MKHLITCLSLVAAHLAAASATAVPFAGCTARTCDSYRGITEASIFDLIPEELMTEEDGLSFKYFEDPASWKDWPMNLLGTYHGMANPVIFPSGYDPAKPGKGLGALNYEKFDYPEAPWAKSQLLRVASNVSSCCHACRLADSCVAFQFFEPVSLQVKGDITQKAGKCFLLTGGRNQTYWPGVGLPRSGPKSEQKRSPRYFLQSSFLGGRCAQKVSDDPHFTGAHGTRFDFNGDLDKSFCLTTDVGIQVNALLGGYRSDNTFGATVEKDGKGLRTWIKELGILWKDASGAPHTLHLVARRGKQQERGDGFMSRAALDGDVFETPTEEGASATAGELTLTFVGTEKRGPYDMDKYSLKIGDLLDLSISMRVAHPLLQSLDDAQAHFNVMFNDMKTTERIHGVLGQTYRSTPMQLAKALEYSFLVRLMGKPIQADGDTGKGFLEGAVEDYVTSSVTSPDCKFSSF